MKKAIILSLVFILSFTFNVNSKSKLSKNEMGVYQYNYFGETPVTVMQYAVDTVCQICYFRWSGGGIVEIPCSKLKKRPEWKDVITWEE